MSLKLYEIWAYVDACVLSMGTNCFLKYSFLEFNTNFQNL